MSHKGHCATYCEPQFYEILTATNELLLIENEINKLLDVKQ